MPTFRCAVQCVMAIIHAMTRSYAACPHFTPIARPRQARAVVGGIAVLRITATMFTLVMITAPTATLCEREDGNGRGENAVRANGSFFCEALQGHALAFFPRNVVRTFAQHNGRGFALVVAGNSAVYQSCQRNKTLNSKKDDSVTHVLCDCESCCRQFCPMCFLGYSFFPVSRMQGRSSRRF